MPSTIITKNSSTASSVPSAGSLTQGELAVNVADKRLYTKDSGGNVVEVGTNPASLTMPNGTANGIPYLNGSKVVTSGSALVFDGSNLGLGVTPSSWDSTFKALESGAGSTNGGSFFVQNNGDYTTSIATNLYYNAGWKYKNTASSGRYEVYQNTHKWYNAPSGTAGNAITFTQAMTLDASGNLLVGRTSSDGYRVAALGSTQLLSGYQLTYSGVAAGSVTLTSGGAMAFGLDASTGGTERARIDSSGRFFVGTTTGTGKVNITGTGSASASTPAINIDAGATNASCNISTSTGQLTTSYGTIAMTVANPGNGYYISFNAPDGSYNYAIRGSIALSGTSIAYNTSSDYRLKKDIAPMSGALAKVALLKPVTYKWLDDSEGEGFIAHELAEVVPQCVTGKKDAVDDDGNPEYQGIDTSFLVATLTAALQEQQAIIENLKARLDAANL
jgi:hypothetical protein